MNLLSFLRRGWKTFTQWLRGNRQQQRKMWHILNRQTKRFRPFFMARGWWYRARRWHNYMKAQAA